MNRIRAHLSYANVAATLALLFAMSGGAIAATGGFSSGGKLRACVNEGGGLKLLKSGKHCRKGLKTVAWNVTGPAGRTGAKGLPGSAGAKGASGTQGPAGAAGPSDGFVARQAGSTSLPAEKPTAIVQLTLPASTGYLVTAATELGNSGATTGFVDCTLSDGTTTSSGSTFMATATATFQQTLTLTGSTSGGVMTLSCSADSSGVARNAVITAVRVGALH
jgi:hypothetical protein